jgi:hypothetical protein
MPFEKSMNALLADAQVLTNLSKGTTGLAKFGHLLAKSRFWWSSAFTLLGHMVFAKFEGNCQCKTDYHHHKRSGQTYSDDCLKEFPCCRNQAR